MAKDEKFVGVVVYEANQIPRDGNFGPYHDAVFSLYDPDTGELLDSEDDRVRVFVDDDGGHGGEIDLLLALKKGDEVNLIATQKGKSWKWRMEEFDDLDAGGGYAPASKPANAGPLGGNRRRTSSGGQKQAPAARARAGRTDRPEQAQRPVQPQKADPLELPDDERVGRMLDKMDLMAQIMQRGYSALAREFIADETMDKQVFMPTPDNITSMTQSLFIDGVRDGKWLK